MTKLIITLAVLLSLITGCKRGEQWLPDPSLILTTPLPMPPSTPH